MYSIKNNIENTIIRKKSKFITKLYKINNIEETNNILEQLKKEYKDSTHICYGYIVNGLEKCSDDGEPSGTAGMPILNILKKKNLSNVLAIVIRYFGGIKLGAGGLVRAYSNSVIETLNLTEITEYVDGYLIEIKFDYNDKRNVENILKKYNIIDKLFDEQISYLIELKISDLETLKNELININCIIEIKKRILIN